MNPVRRTHQKRPCGGSLWPVCRTKSPAALRRGAPYGLRRAAPQGRTPRNHTAASARAQRDHRSMLRAADYGGLQVTAAPRKQQRSGKRFAHQLTGHGCRHKSAWNPVQCAATMTDAAQASPWQGLCERGGLGAPFAFNQRHLQSKCHGPAAYGRPPPRLWRRLSSPILSSLEKKESGPRRALDYLSGRHWHGKIFKLDF